MKVTKPLSGRYLAIIGPAEPAAEIEAIAEDAGRLAAKAGAIVVTGGRGGVMEAACRGAKSAGGTTVGLLPGLTRDDANPFVDIAIPTGMGEMRNMLVVRCGEGVLAVGRGYGTLSELGFALRSEKPVVGIESWDLEVAETGGIVRASAPREALDALVAAMVR